MTEVVTYVEYSNKGPGDVLSPIPFSYLEDDDGNPEVSIYADGAVQDADLYEWTGAAEVTLGSAFPEATFVRVIRTTPIDAVEEELDGSSALDWEGINTNFTKVFQTLEEHRDLLRKALARETDASIAEGYSPVMGSYGEFVQGFNAADIGSAQAYAEAAEAAAASSAITLAADPTASPTRTLGKDSLGNLVWAFGSVLNVQDFVCKPGRSTAQNALALANAITHALTLDGGGRLYFPAGTYLFDGANQVTFPKTPGKSLEIAGEWQGTVINVGSNANPAFYVGSAVITGGDTGFRAKDIKFVGASSTSGKAFQLENGNSAEFIGCQFYTMVQAVKLKYSYGVKFRDSIWVNVGGYNVYSSTHCHHLVCTNCAVFNAGVANVGCFLFIDAHTAPDTTTHTDNIVFQNCDFEGCRQITSLTEGCSAMLIQGCYIEYCTVDAFSFGTGAYNLDFRNSWFALGLAFTFHNWFGGSFSHIRMWDYQIAFGTDCSDIEVRDIRLGGTSTLSTSNLWKTISAFLNSATADATYPPQYRLSGDTVRLRGLVTNIPGGGLEVFALPAGYRPTRTGRWACNSGANIHVPILVDASTGNVIPVAAAAGTSAWLEGVSYLIY